MSVRSGMSARFEIVLAALGLLIAAGPFTLYPICDSSMAGPCNSTGYAEIAIGVLMSALAIVSLFVSNYRYRICIGLAILTLSVLSVLAVTTLIGTCEGSMMACNRTGKPGIIAVGTIAAIAGAINLVLIKSNSRRS